MQSKSCEYLMKQKGQEDTTAVIPVQHLTKLFSNGQWIVYNKFSHCER